MLNFPMYSESNIGGLVHDPDWVKVLKAKKVENREYWHQDVP